MARILEDENVERYEKRLSQIPPELRVGTYQGKTPDFVELLGEGEDGGYKYRSYFSVGGSEARGDYMCFVNAKMWAKPNEVRLPDEEREFVEFVEPEAFAENPVTAPALLRKMLVVYVQALPPGAYRVARVILS